MTSGYNIINLHNNYSSNYVYYVIMPVGRKR